MVTKLKQGGKVYNAFPFNQLSLAKLSPFQQCHNADLLKHLQPIKILSDNLSDHG
jgi:hypothetical protein